MIKIRPVSKEKTLSVCNPKLTEEWSAKNSISPDMISANSAYKALWVCSKGHEWTASVALRNHGRGCPYCHGKRVEIGVNDLESMLPEIASEWVMERNEPYTPRMFRIHSQKKVWWHCKNNHYWIAPIYSRAAGYGCPFCSGRYVAVGENDLATINPSLASEWDYSKNGSLTPQMVTPNSEKSVYWICTNKHSWEAKISDRNSRKRGCPYCSGRRAIPGENDLQTLNPALAIEWDYEKNDPSINLSNIKANSGKNVYWKCGKGHSWIATVRDRHKGNGCPYCSGRRPVAGVNDLLTINPELAREWNAEKNGKLTPKDVTANSGRKVWWLCKSGHEWKATVANRNSKGYQCPLCSKN